MNFNPAKALQPKPCISVFEQLLRKVSPDATSSGFHGNSDNSYKLTTSDNTGENPAITGGSEPKILIDSLIQSVNRFPPAISLNHSTHLTPNTGTSPPSSIGTTIPRLQSQMSIKDVTTKRRGSSVSSALSSGDNQRTSSSLSHLVIPFEDLIFLDQVRISPLSKLLLSLVWYPPSLIQIEPKETSSTFYGRWLGKDVVIKVFSGFLVEQTAW